VIPGSSIECGANRVELTQGKLTVVDGSFTLNAKSHLDSIGQSITATCGAARKRGGFIIRVSEYVTIGTNGRMDATCTIGGGDFRLNSVTTFTVGVQGI
jgi:hypothetical protein